MSGNNLRLNFAPVKITGETIIQVGYRSFEKDILSDLRREFAKTHVFRTDRQDDTIIDIPVVPDAEPLSDKVMELDLKETHWHWPSLMNAAIVRAFSGKREIARDHPVEVLGSAKRNFIGHDGLPAWVQKRSLLEFTPRTIFGSDSKPQFGLLCDARVRNLLLATCDQLIEAGLSPLGRYVLVDHPPNDPRLTLRPQIVGRVASISDGQLVLEDHREGYETVEANKARLSGSKADFDWCVRGLLGNDAERALQEANLAASQLHAGPGRLKTIEETLGFLRDDSLEAVPGAQFEISQLLDSRSPSFPTREMIKKPSLVFDPSETRTDDWNERGIKANGPYDQRTFTPKGLNIAVICQDRYEGQVETFVAKFLEGMPDVKTGRRGREQARYGDGFLRRFQLEKANVQTFTSLSPTLESYEKACTNALEHAADTGIQWDLALVQVEEDFKSLPGNQNPYFGTKAALLKNHVAVQSFRLETMQQAPSGLVFTMNQMSLASYAKLGGRPWLLGAEQTVGHELVIGVGSHVATNSRIGGGTRQVGITTVFSSDGGYHLSERTNVVHFDEYAAALTDTLKRTIVRVMDLSHINSASGSHLGCFSF